jgi:Domain of unknown function (DUF4412)
MPIRKFRFFGGPHPVVTESRLVPWTATGMLSGMNPLTRFIALGLVSFAPAVFAADTFEGKISLTMSSHDGHSNNMTYVTNGTLVRFDPEGAPGSEIMDLPHHQITTLMHQQKAYIVRTLPDAGSMSDHAAAAGGAAAEQTVHDPDVQATGKTEKILGYTCNQFLIKDGDKTTELWLAPDLGTFAGLGQGGGNPFAHQKNTALEAKWERLFKGKAGFPMRVITHDGSGKETFKLEATKVEKGGVSAADFAPPPDYQKFQMPDLSKMIPSR